MSSPMQRELRARIWISKSFKDGRMVDLPQAPNYRYAIYIKTHWNKSCNYMRKILMDGRKLMEAPEYDNQTLAVFKSLQRVWVSVKTPCLSVIHYYHCSPMKYKSFSETACIKN